MNSEKLKPLALVALPLLAGCSTYGPDAAGVVDEGFGEANRQTYAAMIVDPEPEYDEPLPTSAELAAQAIERYRTDSVKEPESIRSTEQPQ